MTKEDQIKEVMGLVDSYAKACAEYDSHLDDVPLYDESMDLAREQLDKKHRAIETKLRELLPGWLPIESAPRTGESILVYYEYAEEPISHIARWDDGEQTGEEDIGWWSYTENSVGQMQLDGPNMPTHWMRLPEAPEA